MIDTPVGRDAELDQVRASLAAARKNGGALLVTGEPGVGQTAEGSVNDDHDEHDRRLDGDHRG